MQEKEINPENLQNPKFATLPVDPTILEEEEKIMEGVEDVVNEIIPEDLDKKNYIKISSTLYIQPIKNKDDDDEKELFKILNPETNDVETRELTDKEKKEVSIQQLKESKIKFHSTKNPLKTTSTTMVEKKYGMKTIMVKKKIKGIATNETVNRFNTAYKKKRKRKNKMTKASRKANR